MEETQTWLSENYLTSLLEASVDDSRNIENGVHKIRDLAKAIEGKIIENIKLIDYNVKYALEEGKNYTSTIYKVEVWYKHNSDEIKKKNYMIKKLNKVFIEWFGNKETETYKALPIIEKYINCKFSAKLYAYRKYETIMEDLTELEFMNTDLKLLDYDHCELALKTLAKFHAGSVLLHQKNPKLVEEKMGEEIFLTNDKKSVFIEKFMIKLGDEFLKWPESEKYAEVLKNAGKKFKCYIEDLCSTNRFKVLAHGDFWLNNLMFKYDNGKVCDVIFVDFQTCRYAPPTTDIQYFIASSADLDVRQNRLEELYSVYLEAFNNKLRELGISAGMTRQQLEDNLYKDYQMFFLGLWPLSILLNEPENTFAVNDLDGDKQDDLLDRFSSLFKSKQFRSLIPIVLGDLEKKGVLKRFRE